MALRTHMLRIDVFCELVVRSDTAAHSHFLTHEALLNANLTIENHRLRKSIKNTELEKVIEHVVIPLTS